VIADLEDKKAVDSSKRLSIMSGYSQLCTALGVLCLIRDLALLIASCPLSRRNRGMNKHRNGKVTLGKLCCDHQQVLTDSVLSRRIGCLIALNFYGTAVSQEMEMMGRLRVTERKSSVSVTALNASRGIIARPESASNT